MKKIIKPFNHTKEYSFGEDIVIGVNLREEEEVIAQNIGFSIPLVEGECVVPRYNINIKTKENIDGKAFLLRDLPKEPYYVELPWTAIDKWGNMHSGINIVTRYRFQKGYTEAYNIELIVSKKEDGRYIIHSNAIKLMIENEDKIKFIMNLFLSLFGRIEIYNNKLKDRVKAKHVNFEILRPGTVSRNDLLEIFKRSTNSKNNDVIKLIMKRFEFLNQFNVNDYIVIGKNSFYGYYALQTKKCWILECNFTNNATYIFGDDWEELSKLTKQQVINNSLCKKRIFHTITWEENIKSQMGEK